MRERGLTERTIRRYGLGYGEDHRLRLAGPPSFKIPVRRRRRGEIVSLQERFWPEPWIPSGKELWKRTLGGEGRASYFYPDLPPGRNVALCAGPFDVLSARQNGLRVATTALSGTTFPRALLPKLKGRAVAVVYDVDEEEQAEATGALLRADVPGVEAWSVRLAQLGLPAKGDLNDYYRLGGSTAELLDLIRAESRRAR